MDKDSMLDKVSTNRGNVLVTLWENGECGIITDPMSNCIFRFLKYDHADRLFKAYSGRDEQQPVLCYGFVGWLLHNRGKDVKDVFNGYYEARKQGYIELHKEDEDRWERDLEQEFKCIHAEEEAKCISASNVLYKYLPQCDRDYLIRMCDNYIRFAQKQNNENDMQKVEVSTPSIEDVYHESKPLHYDRLLGDLKEWNDSEKNTRHIQIIDRHITTEEFRHGIRTANVKAITAAAYRGYVIKHLIPYFSNEWLQAVEESEGKPAREIKKSKPHEEFQKQFSMKRYEIK